MYSYLRGFLLEFLDRSLVDTATLVDKVASCGGLSRVYVTDDNYVDMDLFLRHVG